MLRKKRNLVIRMQTIYKRITKITKRIYRVYFMNFIYNY